MLLGLKGASTFLSNSYYQLMLDSHECDFIYSMLLCPNLSVASIFNSCIMKIGYGINKIGSLFTPSVWYLLIGDLEIGKVSHDILLSFTVTGSFA